MAKFVYNNIKNISISYLSFQIKYGYNLQDFYKKKINSCFKFLLAKMLALKLNNLITINK